MLVTLDGDVRDPVSRCCSPTIWPPFAATACSRRCWCATVGPVWSSRICADWFGSAAMMDLPDPDLAAWRHAIEVAVAQWTAQTADEGALRLVYSRGRESGSRADRLSHDQPAGDAGGGRPPRRRRRGAARPRAIAATGVDAMPWLLAGAKTLSYAVNMAALRHAAATRGRRRHLRQLRRLHPGRATFDGGDRRRRRRRAGDACSPRRRGIRSCAAPPSRHCSRSLATPGYDCDYQAIASRRPRCRPRGLAGVEYHSRRTGAHPRRPPAGAGAAARRDDRTGRGRHPQRPLTAGGDRWRKTLGAP